MAMRSSAYGGSGALALNKGTLLLVVTSHWINSWVTGAGWWGRGEKRAWRCGGWGYSGGREKRWGSSASQWGRSEISISLTAACVHSPPRLASHIHSILTIWVWSLRSGDSPQVMLFYLWNGCACENVNVQQRAQQASISSSSLWVLECKHFYTVYMISDGQRLFNVFIEGKK